VRRDVDTSRHIGYDTRFPTGVTGVDHSSAEILQLNDCLKRAIIAYGCAEILVFLHSLTYLLHD